MEERNSLKYSASPIPVTAFYVRRDKRDNCDIGLVADGMLEGYICKLHNGDEFDTRYIRVGMVMPKF